MIYSPVKDFYCNQPVEAAIQQIKDKGYNDPYRSRGHKIILLGINFSPEQRNVTEWQQEILE